MKKNCNDWEKKFFNLEFKDKRLKKRFFHIMDSFSSAPSDGAPGVQSVWKGLEKLYTLLEYKKFLI